MNWAYDPVKDFYYMGSEPAYPGIYQNKIVNAPKLISIDTETISLDVKVPIGLSVATSPSCAFYFPIAPSVSPAMPWQLLRDPAYTKIFHNALFDLFCLGSMGYNLDYEHIRDTNIMARLLCYQFSGLMEMSMVHKMEVHNAGDMMLEAKVKTMLGLPKDAVAKKCMQDSMATLKLYHELLPKTDMPYFLTEMEVIPILVKMSFRGIKLDQELRFDLEEMLEEEVDYYKKLCEEMEGFNPGSSQQAGYVLAKRGAYKAFKRLPFTGYRNTGNLSTGRETLERMDDPLAAIVLNYRQKASLLRNYIVPWANEERASTRFHLDAITGRPSSTERNLQNIPQGEPRGIFLPDSAIFTDADFSQIELRILAYLSGDKEMQYIFSLPKLNPDGSRNEEADIHQQTADFLGIPRKPSKNVNFAMVYGADDQTLMETAHIRSLDRSRQLRDLWFQKFPQAGDWIQGIQARTLDDPYAYTIYGRRIRLDAESDDVGSMMRKNVNYRIQGSAAEIMKRALIKCQHLDMALTVHDEILVDGYVEEQWLRDMLEDIAPLHTPIDVQYLARWQ